MVPLQSSSCLIPDLVNARPFPSALTTMAFDHSRQRWFGTCSCKPAPRGLPSSEKQLRATWPCGPFALVAHNYGQSAPYCLFAPTGIAVPPRTAGFGKWQDWIAPAAGFHRIGGRIIAHRECASGCITLQPAPARFSIEVAQNPVLRDVHPYAAVSKVADVADRSVGQWGSAVVA